MAVPPSSACAHALVVDDDPNVRQVVCRLLTRHFEGLRVTEATNGLEALDRLSRERFAIALLDLTMPLMDGFDVLETVRRDPALRGLPVVMLSGINDAATVKRIMDLGVNDYILKPVHPTQFLDRVNRVLSGQSRGAGGDAMRAGFSPMELTGDTPVIIADGSEELRQFVERVMAPMCPVQTVSSGLEVFRHCLEAPPYAVFLGPELGVLKSEVLARKMRQHPRLRGVRLIGIEPQRTLVQARKRSTLDAVILQSFVPEVFMEGLKSLLARPGSSSRLLSSVPDLKLLAISTGEEVLSAALGQHVVLRPQQSDRKKKPVMSATRAIDTGPDGSPLLVTVSAPARRLAEVSESRTPGQLPGELLDHLLGRLVDAIAGSLRDRGLPASCDSPANPRRRGAAAASSPEPDDAMTFDFDVPGEKLTLTVGLTDTEDAAAAPPALRSKSA